MAEALFAADGAVSASALTANAYELARMQRLQANKQFLASLGFADLPLVKETEAKPKAKRAKKNVSEPTRRSLRSQGLTPEGEALSEDAHEPNNEGDCPVDLESDVVMAAKIERLKAMHAENGTLPKNPTATYEHKWMRVKTMSDSALAKRIKVIEGAVGQHCIVKMQMFTEVLALAGKQELADQARQALQRLCDLVGQQKSESARIV